MGMAATTARVLASGAAGEPVTTRAHPRSGMAAPDPKGELRATFDQDALGRACRHRTSMHRRAATGLSDPATAKAERK